MGGGGSQWTEEGLGAGSLVQVLPDGVVVHGGRQCHEHVPDGVGEGDDAVALEEDDAEAVDEAAARQLVEPVSVVLKTQRRKSCEPSEGPGPNVAQQIVMEKYETNIKTAFDEDEQTRTNFMV